MKHSIFSASGAERWANCPGSIPYCEGIPRTGSDASWEGTAGHALSERCLRDGGSPYDSIGEVFKFTEAGRTIEVTITDDLAEACEMYVEYVRGISGLKLYETRVYYSELLGVDEEEAFGTTDTLVFDGTLLHVIDAKFGRRYVDPVKNKQMILYAGGAVAALEAVGEEVTEVRLHVVQPRVTTKPVPYVMTRAELEVQLQELRAAASTVVEAMFNYVPGNTAWEEKYLIPGEYQCQWCPAAAACPSLRHRARSVTPVDEFTAVNNLEAMTGTLLSESAKLLPLLEIWMKAVEHELFRRLTRRDHVPGYKLVKGREGNRKWISEEKVKEAFAGIETAVLYTEPSLKTPPQLEKALKKDPRKTLIESLVMRSPAKPTVTTEDDPREPWSEAAGADEFGIVAE